MKMGLLVCSATFVLTLTGCSTTQVSVLPQANNQYQLIATASSSTDALDGAMDKANTICKKTNQKPIVMNSNVKYQGMNQNVTQLATMAATAINMNSNSYVPGPDTSKDYEATLTIQCQ